MTTIKCKVVRQHPLLANEVGEEVELQESSFNSFSKLGVVEALEPEEKKPAKK